MNVALYFIINCIFITVITVQGSQEYFSGRCEEFKCLHTGKCIPHSYVCDDERDCGTSDESDEYDCTSKLSSTPVTFSCNSGYHCPTSYTCIEYSSICDGKFDCADGNDETECGIQKVMLVAADKLRCIQWLLNRRSNATVNKWGLQVHRTAVALYLADKEFFAPDNKTGEEIRYELTIHLLSILHRREILRTEQLALYVHAMIVACLQPRDFFKHNLVSDLRKRVDTSKYTSPLAILVLCNAGANMTMEDVNRLNDTFFSQYRPFWTEVQVMSTMALSCIKSKTSVSVNNTMLKQWVESIKKLQFGNGTIVNTRTTALVIQMLLGTGYVEGFNWQGAILSILTPSFFSSSNFLDMYYLIPVLSERSFTAIDSSHCSQLSYSADLFRKIKERMTVVHYTVWMDKDIDIGRSWRLRMPSSSSLYDVMEKVKSIEPTHTVVYNMVDGEPYVSSVFGVNEDPETGYYWFTYERTKGTTDDPTLREESPVNIIVRDDQELIIWYRNGLWNSQSYGSGDHS